MSTLAPITISGHVKTATTHLPQGGYVRQTTFTPVTNVRAADRIERAASSSGSRIECSHTSNVDAAAYGRIDATLARLKAGDELTFLDGEGMKAVIKRTKESSDSYACGGSSVGRCLEIVDQRGNDISIFITQSRLNASTPLRSQLEVTSVGSAGAAQLKAVAEALIASARG